MPLPTQRDVHVDELLTNLLLGWQQKADAVIADKLFPIVPVAKQSARYGVMNRSDFFRNEVKEKADGTESVSSGYRVTNNSTYFCPVYGLKDEWGEQRIANQTAPFDVEKQAAQYLLTQHLINRESLFASTFLTASVWGTTMTGVSGAPGAGQFLQWDNPSSTPIEDVSTGIETIRQNTGYVPNTLALGPIVYRRLIHHPDIVGRIGNVGTEPRTANLVKLASILDVEKIVVGRAVQTTSLRGAATDTYADLVGRTALLSYAAPNPMIGEPSAGYIFAWTGLLGANAYGGRVRKGMDEKKPSWWVDVEMSFDPVIVASELGYFFNTAGAAL